MAGYHLYAVLERLSALLRAEERRAGQAHGLQPVHLQILAYLARCNRYSDTPLAVSEYLGIKKGTISQSLQILVRDGHLARRPDPADGRVVHLSLTPAGRQLVDLLIPPAGFLAAIEQMRETDRLALSARLVALLGDLQAANGSQAFGVCHTCRHFERHGGGLRCGLTLEPLETQESELLCREHAASVVPQE